jgi:hypothetical protein
MEAFFASGRAADLVLLAIVAELALLVVLRLSGRGPPLSAALYTIASGACLVLALRAALVQAPWTLVAAGLMGSLVAHALDLRARLAAHR